MWVSSRQNTMWLIYINCKKKGNVNSVTTKRKQLNLFSDRLWQIWLYFKKKTLMWISSRHNTSCGQFTPSARKRGTFIVKHVTRKKKQFNLFRDRLWQIWLYFKNADVYIFKTEHHVDNLNRVQEKGEC
jgi:hypothetical protein